MANTQKAVILLSGGLDSATTLAIARREGYACYALTFRYGQRHVVEIKAAKRVTNALGAREHRILDIDLGSLGGSALTDMNLEIPKRQDDPADGIPITYVPARNTIFLAYALAWAEILRTFDIYIGANAVDYSGYPDCRPAFIEAFEKMANLATAAGDQSKGTFKIHTPIIQMSKAQIIKTGIGLGIDYSLTHSCYDPDEAGRACGVCDSCRLRKKGFQEAGIPDPTIYFRPQ